MTFELNHWDDPIQSMYGRGTHMTHLFAAFRPAFSFMEIVDNQKIRDEKQTILDFGGGTGRVSMYLCLYYNTPTVSYDPNQDCVRVGTIIKDDLKNDHLKANLEITNDIPDQQFDYVLSLAVLEHLSGQVFTDAMNDMTNCLKDGGYMFLYLREHNRAQFQQFVMDELPPFYDGHTLVLLEKTGDALYLKKISPKRY
jgi:cyclopropane fatty-acyl-phospholipid synthase-like methyltransferase